MEKSLEQRIAALEKVVTELHKKNKRDTVNRFVSIMLTVVLFVNIAINGLYLMVKYLMTQLP